MSSLLNMKEGVPSTSTNEDGGGGPFLHLEEHEELDEDEEGSESPQSKEESGSEEPSPNNKKKRKLSRKDRNRRKNISTVLKDEDLDERTKDARAEEADRLKRLHEFQMRARMEQHQRQILNDGYSDLNGIYHKPPSLSIKSETTDIINLVSTSGSENENIKRLGQSDDDVEVISIKKDDAKIEDPSNSGMHVDDRFNVADENGRILINIGHPKEDSDVFLIPQLEKIVKPHQIGGIRFLYDNIIESLSNYNSIGYGCILAHSMGLGKTIQVVCFTDIFLRYTPGKRVLIIVPINTIQNWLNEYNQWIPSSSSSTYSWSKEIEPRDYEVFILNDNCKNLDQRGRLIENWYSKGGVLLMGYELYRQLANKKPRKKRKRKGPECIDIEEEDKEKVTLDSVQSALVDPGPDLIICDEGHRIKNSHASISSALKAVKTRRRVVLTGYPLQNNLMEYWCMVDFVRPNFLGTKTEFANMFERPIQNGQCADSLTKDVRLMKHRAHVLHNQLKGFVQRRSHVVLTKSLPPKEEHIIMLRMTPFQRYLYTAFMKDLLGANSVTNPLKAFAVALKIYNHPDVLYHFLKKREINNAMDLDFDFDEFGVAINPKNGKVSFKKEEIDYDWINDSMDNYETGLIENSPKMCVFFSLLRKTLQENDRMLLFSQSLLSLNLIEEFLKKEEPELKYFRLDGSTSGLEREKLISTFNKDDSIKLFLISTKAGSLGINLIGANRVVVFDASWNPCHDSQAVCRVYRYGQKKTSFIYRLIVDNCLERTIYDRQINKQGMSNRIVDELNPELRFQTKEIQTLLRSNEEDPPLNGFKIEMKTEDSVLANTVRNYYDLLTCNPFTHESLLIDRGDQKLSKAEKRLAERSYQIEKKAKISYGRPSYSAFYPKTDVDYSKNVRWPPSPSIEGAEGGHANSGTSSSFGSPLRGGTSSYPPLHSPSYPIPSQQYHNNINNQTTQQLPVPTSPLSEFQKRMTPSVANQAAMDPSSSSFPAEALSRQGVTFKHLVVQNDLLIPTNIPDSPLIALKRGQKVMIIRTSKGIYIRMGDQVIKIKLPPELLKEILKPSPSSSTEVVTLSDSDSEHNNTTGPGSLAIT
uniref:Helicase ARIP4like [Pundamilia nyererei] n=1 Tax=Lepeophtheirus salmonis TaxID=72036 RepID=A0A0K2TD83_LEPSM